MEIEYDEMARIVSVGVASYAALETAVTFATALHSRRALTLT